MYYPLNNLVDDRAFEKLIASICKEILGTGTIIFSEGKDGGRDAKFTGKANCFPSKNKSWDGKIVIQAKHTIRPYAKCSEADFRRILKKEVIPKIKDLKDENKIEYYLLFTNRRLSGIEDAKIEDLLDEQVGVENFIIGDETLQGWLQENPKIVKTHGLNKLLLPLQFFEDDLREIIIAFSEIEIEPDKIKEISDEISRIDIEEKNELNNLSKDYFNNVFRKSYSHFEQIETFLESPINTKYKNHYNNTIADLQEKIIVHIDNYVTFDEVFNYLYEYVFQNNQTKLKDIRALIRIFLHYMYNNCDIGKENND